MGTDLEDMFAESFANADGSDADFDTDLDLAASAQVHTGDEDDDTAFGVDEDDEDVSDDDDESESDDLVDDDDDDDTDGATDESGFDWTTVKDQKVAIKVDGQEMEVTLEELRNGYMRQADYTRKTQETAAMRQAADWAVQVQKAFQADPEGTLQYLARAAGLDARSVLAPDIDPYEDLDPEVREIVKRTEAQERQIAEMQARIEAQAQAQADEAAFLEAQRELWAAKQEFPEMDERKVLELAATKDISIREAHLLLEAEKLIDQQKKAKSAATKAAEIAAKQEAKKMKAGKTLKGASARGKSADIDQGFDSFEDLFISELAKAR